MDDQLKLQQLMQAYQAAKQQGVPDSLNPNAPTQQPDLTQTLMKDVGNPNSPALYANQNVPKTQGRSVADMFSGGIPDSLAPNLPDQYPDLNRILMQGVPGFTETLPQGQGPLRLPTDKQEEVEAPEKEDTKQEEKPSEQPAPTKKPEANDEDDSDEEDTEEEQPTATSSQLKQIPKRDGKYDLNTLQAKMQAARKAASITASSMAGLAGVSAITGAHFDMTGFKDQYANQLGQAADYQRLIQEQRLEDEQDIRHAAADINYSKALTEVKTEKSANDPNSEYSTAVRGMAASILTSMNKDYPVDSLNKMSASQIGSILPQAIKATDIKYSSDIKKEIQDSKNAALSLQRQSLNDMKASSLNKSVFKDPAADVTGRSGLGLAHLKYQSAEQLMTTINTYAKNGDLNNIPESGLVDLNMQLGALLSPTSVPPVSVLQALDKPTLARKVSGLYSSLSGSPMPGNYGDFVKNIQKLAKEQQGVQRNLLNNYIEDGYKKAKNNAKQFNSNLADMNADQQYSDLKTRYGLNPEQHTISQQPVTQPVMVKMYDPQGKLRLVPENQVDAAIRAGGRKAE